MREISISYGEYGLKFTKECLTNNKLLEMFEKIDIENEELVEMFAKVMDVEHTTYYCIYRFCSKLLEDQRVANSSEIVVNFLSIDIFCAWFQKVEGSEEHGDESQICIE